jgi:proteasome accessory factor C
MSSTAAQRLARMLALVPWLTAHPGVTMTECADHFGVSEEQLQKDLWQIVVCGVPGYGPDQLVDIQFWDDGVIRVLDPQTLDRPLRLTHEEALSLLVALRMLAQLPGIEDRAAIASAAAKLEQAASGAGSERFVVVRVDVPPEVTAAVDLAVAERRALRIRYASATKDEVTERTVRPFRLFATDGVSYLEGYCETAEAMRTFRLDRVLAADVGDLLPEGAGSDPIPVADDGPRAGRTALLEVDPSARWIIDVHDGRLESDDPASGRATVRLPLLSDDWAVRLVLSLRGAARVVEPPDLARAVGAAAAAAQAAYRQVP